jgi:RNA polymerase sigma factor FliA
MDADLTTLWQCYKVNRHFEERNRLFQYYSNWIRKVTSVQFSRYGGQLVDWSDCMQNASIALIEAIERFDLDRGVPFEAYAYTRIKGAIINGITHFQREKRHGVVRESDYEFLNDIKLSENSEDVFDSFVDSVIDLAFSKMLDMASYKFNEIGTNPLDLYMSISEEEKVMHSVGMLSSDLQYIINAHYNHYLTFTQIAQQLGVSRSRVSQLHRDALKRLRSIYELN